MGKKKRGEGRSEDAALDKAARKALKTLAKERRSAGTTDADVVVAAEPAAPASAGKPTKSGKKSKSDKKSQDARAAAEQAPELGDAQLRDTRDVGATKKTKGDAKPGEKKARDKKSRPGAPRFSTSSPSTASAESAAPEPAPVEPATAERVPTQLAVTEPAQAGATGGFTVDVVVVALAVRDRALLVAASPALPSTELRPGEPLVAAAARALGDAGLRAGDATLLPLVTDVAGRDHLQVGWVALCAPDALDDAAWLPAVEIDEGRALVEAAVERVGTMLETTTLAAAMVATEFTVGELRGVYEAVWGVDPDGRNFHRKVTGVADFLVETGERTTRGGGRPAMVHRAGPARRLNPALTRP